MRPAWLTRLCNARDGHSALVLIAAGPHDRLLVYLRHSP